jgi:hypothetical protein
MQLIFPFFPEECTMISKCLGVYTRDDIVQYILNGMPAYCHSKGDLTSFRFITSNFISQKLCKNVDVARCFSVTIDSVSHSLQLFKKEGIKGFFTPENRHGHSYIIIGETKELIQKMLNEGGNPSSIGRELGIGESTIRQSIKSGNLKKKS